jgi:hypothetical protein
VPPPPSRGRFRFGESERSGSLTGEKIGGTTVSYGRADLRFGFTTFEPAAQGGWTATFRDVGGKSYFDCKIVTGEVSCN